MSERKLLRFVHEHDLAKLHDELLAAGLAVERLEGDYGDDDEPIENGVRLVVPDDVDEKLVQRIVQAHDPTPAPPRPPGPSPIEEIVKVAQSPDTTLDDMKRAVAEWLPKLGGL